MILRRLTMFWTMIYNRSVNATERMDETMYGKRFSLMIGIDVVIGAVISQGSPTRTARGASGGGSLIGDGMARFLAPGVDEAKLPPSFALVSRPEQKGPLPASWSSEAPSSRAARPMPSTYISWWIRWG